jgi:hypothetical protein
MAMALLYEVWEGCVGSKSAASGCVLVTVLSSNKSYSTPVLIHTQVLIHTHGSWQRVR